MWPLSTLLSVPNVHNVSLSELITELSRRLLLCAVTQMAFPSTFHPVALGSLELTAMDIFVGESHRKMQAFSPSGVGCITVFSLSIDD